MDFKTILIFALSAVSVHAVVPEMTVRSSSVPNYKYEVDAVKALEEAYSTHPDDFYYISRTFTELFEANHPSSDGWKVFIGCTSYYVYSSRNFIYIAINVKINDDTSVVTIFN